MQTIQQQAVANLAKLRESRPLIHNITNFVVMNFTANILLACGASPVMAHAENEVEDMVGFARALVLNIGTLTDDWVDAMVKAGKKASSLGVPIILDPVGAGATALRTNAAKRILAETKVSVVRGNASEILALAGARANTKGVDAVDSVDQATDQAIRMARELGVPVAITGPQDLITDGTRVIRVNNGHPLMGAVTGTGCGATAVIAAFCGVDPDPVAAASSALAYYGLAGERAAIGADGPGTFVPRFLDSLYNLTPADLETHVKISQ